MDADDTLLDFGRAEAGALRAAMVRVGMTPFSEALSLYSAINSALWKALERGEVTRSALMLERFVRFCAVCREQYGIDGDPQALSDCYPVCLSEQSHTIPGALEVCRELSACCRLYIITNGSRLTQPSRLRGSGLLPYVQKVFLSEEIGVTKPDPAFFEAVRRGIPDFCAARTLVVGDSLSADILGAYRAGLDACLYDPARKPLPDDPDLARAIRYRIAALEELPSVVKGADV